MKPKITVIISTKDRARYLMETLNSLVHQTMDEWECIVVQNTCGDWTDFSINTFSDNRISTYEHKVPGKCNALNFVQDNVKIKSPYVSLFDDDDIMMPCNLETKLKMFEDTGADLVYSAYYALLGNNEMIYCPSKDFNYDSFINRPYFGHGATACKTDFWLATKYNPEYTAALDYEWVTRATRTAKKLAYTNIPLYMYRKQPNSISEAQRGNLSRFMFAKAQTAAEEYTGKVKTECERWYHAQRNVERELVKLKNNKE